MEGFTRPRNRLSMSTGISQSAPAHLSYPQTLSSLGQFWVVLVVTSAVAPSSVAGNGKLWLCSSGRGYMVESRTMSPSASPWQHGLCFALAFLGGPSIFRLPSRCGHGDGFRAPSPSGTAGSWLGMGLAVLTFSGKGQEKGVTGLTKWGQAGPRRQSCPKGGT